VGPPPSAIHGRGRLTRHPCRVAHCAKPALGLPTGQVKIKIKSRIKSQSQSGVAPTSATQIWLLPLFLTLISSAPSNHAGRNSMLIGRGYRQDAGLAALDYGHAEPKRGAKWWGKSLLLTFGLFKSEAPSGRNQKPPSPQQRICTHPPCGSANHDIPSSTCLSNGELIAEQAAGK